MKLYKVERSACIFRATLKKKMEAVFYSYIINIRVDLFNYFSYCYFRCDTFMVHFYIKHPVFFRCGYFIFFLLLFLSNFRHVFSNNALNHFPYYSSSNRQRVSRRFFPLELDYNIWLRINIRSFLLFELEDEKGE